MLNCPRCHHQFEWEDATNDKSARMINAMICKEMPKSVQLFLPEYLGLFRQGTRASSWAKLERLVRELIDMIKAGNHSWDSQPERFISPEMWAEAIERTTTKRPEKLQNHNYLRHIAYELADPNKKRELPWKKPASPAAPQPENAEAYSPINKPKLVLETPMTDEQRRKNQSKLQELLGKIGSKGLPEKKPDGKP